MKAKVDRVCKCGLTRSAHGGGGGPGACAQFVAPARGAASPKQPMQPLEVDPTGVVRFKANALVRFLLSANGKIDMNTLALLPNVSREDRSQFAQLIGYSVSGYGELSYAVDVTKADRLAAKLAKPSKRRTRRTTRRVP